MDPLSAAASILGVLTVAAKLAQGLQKLVGLKDAPQEIFNLSNSVIAPSSLT